MRNIKRKLIAVLLTALLCIPGAMGYAEETPLDALAVCYISETALGGGQGVYMAAGQDGYYTATDGVNWTLRASGSFGGIAVDGNNNIRQGIAYGGKEEKIALIADGKIGASLHYTDADLNYLGSVDAVDAESQEPLYVHTLLWDDYTQRFWCAANPVNGSAIVGVGGIYYSVGLPENGRFLWHRVELGDGDLFTEVNTADARYAKYMWLNTNGAGAFVYGAACVKQTGGARYSCGVIQTDAALEETSVKRYALTKGTEILGDNNPYALETGETSDANGHKDAWDVKYAVLDTEGRLIVAPGNMKSGMWYRLVNCDYQAETAEWHWGPTASGNLQGISYGYMVMDQNQLVAIPVSGPARTGSLRSKAAVDLIRVPYSAASGFDTGTMLLHDEALEIKLFGDQGSKCNVTSACLNGSQLLLSLQDSAANGSSVVMIDLDTRSMTRGVVKASEIAAVAIQEEAPDPGKEGGMQLSGRLLNASGAETAGRLSWAMLEGNQAVSLAESGEISVAADAAIRQARLKVRAFAADAPSVFATKEFTFYYIYADTELTIDGGQLTAGASVKAKVAYHNPGVTEQEVYTVLCIYRDACCVDSVVWQQKVPAGQAELAQSYSYTLPERNYQGATAKLFVLSGASMCDMSVGE